MTAEQYLKNLEPPKGKVDVVLDTDAYNEIDDQFAITYLLRCSDRFNTKAIYAAPFYNHRSTSPADGMEKSYDEILKLLDLMDEKRDVFKGSDRYLPDEKTPVISPAAEDLVKRAQNYSPENPLYVVGIGAITNVASAIILNPEICENIVLVWLGGHAHHFEHTAEFNMMQDIAAARVVLSSKAPIIHLTANGVISDFKISGPELKEFFFGKNKVAEYLAKNTFDEVASYAKTNIWTRVIWDVITIAWLRNENNCFMQSKIVPVRLPSYNNHYEEPIESKLINYVYFIERDAIMNDLVNKIC